MYIASDVVASSQVGQYFGFVDMLDIVRYVTDLIGETVMSKADFDLEKAAEFKHATVKDLMSAFYDRPFLCPSDVVS